VRSGSRGEVEPAREVGVEDVEAAGAEAKLARLDVDEHVVPERDGAGEPRVGDAWRPVHLDPREAGVALDDGGDPTAP
jgi:hypothetical protein